MNSPLATTIREYAIVVLAYLLWGWTGFWTAFCVLALLNIAMEHIVVPALTKFIRRAS